MLNTIRATDQKDLIDHLNDWSVVQWLACLPYPYTEDAADSWFERVSESELKLNLVYMTVILGALDLP
ncbi:MAG: hypothetical protein P8Q37_08365 [Porticoccaceae bacterium]|nr:hypothetical protein [Porticoccaceae bacterium]MDG1474905.1 hypothetical protein [Porticoccaceae bacterium]